eukprot:GHVR01129571.1.p3 GENE.GHVR01129571.1~~GHVR01129571.1.p3  ORF type:complete len:110 (+),score=20.06 GHVR01129571.1:1294-1623(+)
MDDFLLHREAEAGRHLRQGARRIQSSDSLGKNDDQGQDQDHSRQAEDGGAEDLPQVLRGVRQDREGEGKGQHRRGSMECLPSSSHSEGATPRHAEQLVAGIIIIIHIII